MSSPSRSDETDAAAVLSANQDFYDAFAARDLSAMEDLWAREHPVACVHPGWDALRGRDAVMASWRSILENGSAPQIRFIRARAHLLGTTAYVIGYERLEGATLVATNFFVREGDAWKIIHHQASPVRVELEDHDDEDEDHRTLN